MAMMAVGDCCGSTWIGISRSRSQKRRSTDGPARRSAISATTPPQISAIMAPASQSRRRIGAGPRLELQETSGERRLARLGVAVDLEDDRARSGGGAVDAAGHQRLLVTGEVVEAAAHQAARRDGDLETVALAVQALDDHRACVLQIEHGAQAIEAALDHHVARLKLRLWRRAEH